MGTDDVKKIDNLTFYVIDEDGKPGEPIGFSEECFVTTIDGDGLKAGTHTFVPIDICGKPVELRGTLSKKSVRKLKKLIRRIEIKMWLEKIFKKKGSKYYGKDC